ncbi:MAG TPA: hypothetical protein VMU14_21590, partial [Acidimicrobiales bacterium]|nr:hypothetical protein [Acidimicrobiales bacterium]
IDLNLASIDATTMPGTITTSRTALNVSGKAQTLDVSTVAPAGVSIIISKTAPGPSGPTSAAKFSVPKNGSTTFWVTISAPSVAAGQYVGRITLTPEAAGFNPVTIPVAFVKTQGAVTLSQSCSPTTMVVKTGQAHCTATVSNLAPATANATLNVKNVDAPLGSLVYSNISAPGSALPAPGGVTWTGALTPSLPPQVTSITDITGSGPAGGYLPLSLFGIAPISGVGDDTITNFNVPTFFYGGEPYTRIGVVSNGYVVVGGGNASDINFFPQTFPNPARPNNVVAPFWTDLNPPAGGAVRIATLTDGASTWLVVDYDAVKNFSNATTHTGEIWVRLATGSPGTGPSSEQLTVSYGTANAASGDPGSSMNWGAENRDGTSGVNIASAPADNSEYRVTLTGPTAGGSVTITYDVSSKNVGTYRTRAAMTSDLTPGTTQIDVPLTITYP